MSTIAYFRGRTARIWREATKRPRPTHTQPTLTGYPVVRTATWRV
jgi:hypothetical protein